MLLCAAAPDKGSPHRLQRRCAKRAAAGGEGGPAAGRQLVEDGAEQRGGEVLQAGGAGARPPTAALAAAHPAAVYEQAGLGWAGLRTLPPAPPLGQHYGHIRTRLDKGACRVPAPVSHCIAATRLAAGPLQLAEPLALYGPSIFHPRAMSVSESAGPGLDQAALLCCAFPVGDAKKEQPPAQTRHEHDEWSWSFLGSQRVAASSWGGPPWPVAQQGCSGWRSINPQLAGGRPHQQRRVEARVADNCALIKELSPIIRAGPQPAAKVGADKRLDVGAG